MHLSLSPEMLQAGAVNGLNQIRTIHRRRTCYLADLSEDADVADKDDGDREEEGQSHLVQVGVKHHIDSFVVPVTQAVAPVRHHHYEAEHLWT